MNLGELIKELESADQDRRVPMGFGNPHSFRGSYDELAFEPIEDVRVSDMLYSAKSALGNTYQGYKGGDYKMTADTPVWIAWWGSSYGAESIGPIFLRYMLGIY